MPSMPQRRALARRTMPRLPSQMQASAVPREEPRVGRATRETATSSEQVGPARTVRGAVRVDQYPEAAEAADDDPLRHEAVDLANKDPGIDPAVARDRRVEDPRPARRAPDVEHVVVQRPPRVTDVEPQPAQQRTGTAAVCAERDARAQHGLSEPGRIEPVAVADVERLAVVVDARGEHDVLHAPVLEGRGELPRVVHPHRPGRQAVRGGRPHDRRGPRNNHAFG
jgi:hypothetical protein